ncbi:MAG TPA: hypothetical protein VK968_01940 [Roseimicrobium sp.]|nr:hypothetical protein [Roseimicrobium sp.]
MNRTLLTLLAGLTILCACKKPAQPVPPSFSPIDGSCPQALAPRTFSDWRDSKDGAVSFCLAIDKTVESKGRAFAVRGALRNNTDRAITLLLPFGDKWYAGSSGIVIVGPEGTVPYRGPIADYVLGESSFIELGPHKTVEDVLRLSTDHFPALNKKGLYRLTYFYLSSGYPSRVHPESYWEGEITSNSVDVLITDD